MIRQNPAPPSAQSIGAFLEAVQEQSTRSADRPFYLIVGPAGVGKTTALRAYLRQQHQTEDMLVLEASPRITASTFIDGALHKLHWPPAHGSIVERTREAQDALRYFNTTLIVLDQAEQLPTALFDVILELARVCPLVLMGRAQALLPKLQHPYVWKNLQATLRTTPLAEADILQRLLPSLALPRFAFDPTDERDLALGRALWKLTSPSLRDLRRVAEQADEIAEGSDVERVTLECIHAGFAQAVRDAPGTGWSELMWVLATGLLRQEYKEAHECIEQGSVSVNGQKRRHWWWIVQTGDQLWSKSSERKTNTLAVDERLLRQANALRRRIERLKPGGRAPYL
jgi:hypothetical protein